MNISFSVKDHKGNTSSHYIYDENSNTLITTEKNLVVNVYSEIKNVILTYGCYLLSTTKINVSVDSYCTVSIPSYSSANIFGKKNDVNCDSYCTIMGGDNNKIKCDDYCMISLGASSEVFGKHNNNVSNAMGCNIFLGNNSNVKCNDGCIVITGRNSTVIPKGQVIIKCNTDRFFDQINKTALSNLTTVHKETTGEKIFIKNNNIIRTMKDNKPGYTVLDNLDKYNINDW